MVYPDNKGLRNTKLDFEMTAGHLQRFCKFHIQLLFLCQRLRKDISCGKLICFEVEMQLKS